MPTSKKKPKPLVGTWYAIRVVGSRDRFLDRTWTRFVAFPGAVLFGSRVDASDLAKRSSFGGGKVKGEIVPVRCRPLTSKKRNPKRTR